jgi:anti-sigma B factor antagonist
MLYWMAPPCGFTRKPTSCSVIFHPQESPVGLADGRRRGLRVAFCASASSARARPQPFVCRLVIIAIRSERLFIVSFSVKIRQQGNVALVDVSGHLTFFEVHALRDSVQSLLREKRNNILLNLSELNYLDSSGIGELARIYVAVVKQGGAMRVVGLAPRVEEILKVTHLSQVFQEFPDEQTALRSFAQ